MNPLTTASTFARTATDERHYKYGGNTLTPYEIAPNAVAGLREALDTHPAKDRICEECDQSNGLHTSNCVRYN